MPYKDVKAARAANRKSYRAHRASRLASAAGRYDSALAREYYKTNAGRIWARNLLKKYGITPEQYSAMLEKQGGHCALFEVCGSVQPGGRGQWHVDHDHVTGKVRGLLCHNCNINKVGSNDLQSARAVVRYLEASEVPHAAS